MSHHVIGSIVALIISRWPLPPRRTLPSAIRTRPVIPGQKWKVHDIDRPRPRQVTPATRPGSPPSDAIVLFDGKDLSKWNGVKNGKVVPAAWKVENGYMEVVAGAGILTSKDKFGTAQYHVEWTVPHRDQGQQPGPRQQRLLPHGQVRDPGARFAANNLTYADGQASAHLRPVAAAGERRRASRASGRPTTSSSKRRSSRATKSSSRPT